MSLCPDRLTPKIGRQLAAGSSKFPQGDRGGTGKGLLIVDDLVDTGKTGRLVCDMSGSANVWWPHPFRPTTGLM